MLFYGLDQFNLKRSTPIGHAKATIMQMPAGASCNLGHFIRVKLSHPPPIKFNIGRQCHMRDVKIEPHAYRVGRDQKINITILI